MNKLSKKGFTLVELLAVIVILLVIISIVFPKISASINRQKDKQWEAVEKIIVNAAQIYVEDNKSRLITLNTGGTIGVSLQTLVDAGLLKTPLQDPRDNSNVDLSNFVTVRYNDANFSLIYTYGATCDGITCEPVVNP